MSLRALNRALKGREDLLERLLLVAEAEAEPVTTLTTPDAVYAIVAPMLIGLEVEHLVCVALNRRRHVIGKTTISIGNDGFTIVDPRPIFRWALQQGRSGARAIILAHNHPSGDPTPSKQDWEVTDRIVKAGHILGIELLDHVVIGDTKYESLAALGAIR